MIQLTLTLTLLVTTACLAYNPRNDIRKGKDGVVFGPISFMPREPSTQIIYGERANEGEFPHMGMLRNGKRFTCGASLLNENWALTAAHCVAGARASNLDVVFGMHYVWDVRRNGTTSVVISPVEDVVAHKDYVGQRNWWQNDIAVLKLRDPVRLGKAISPIVNHQNMEETFADRIATLSGWGRTERSTGSQYLRKYNFTILDNDECELRLRHLEPRVKLVPSHICVYDDDASPCAGDSGGPLISNVNNGRGALQQIGLTSWGPGSCSMYPGVFTRLSHFAGWIRNSTEDENIFRKIRL